MNVSRRRLNGPVLRLVDQGLFSIGNIAVVALVSHSATATVAGSIIVLLVVYPVAGAFAQGYIVDFHLVFASEPYTSRQAWRGGLLAGLPLAFLVPVLLFISDGNANHSQAVIAATILCACTPGLTAQYAGRAYSLGTGRVRFATINDGAWLVGQAVLYLFGRTAGLTSTTAAVMSWSVAGSVCGLAFLFGDRAGRMGPPPDGPVVRLRAKFAGELVLGQASAQINLVLVGAIVGLASLAGYRIAQVVLGPLLVGVAALRHALVPRYAALYRTTGSPRPVARQAVFHAALVAAALQGTALFMWALPPTIGAHIFGASWAEARPLIPLVGLDMAAAGAGLVLAVSLRALLLATDGLVIRMIISGLAVASVLVACLTVGTAPAVAAAGAFASCAGVVLYLGLLARVTRGVPQRPAAHAAELAAAPISGPISGPVSAPVARAHAAYPIVHAGAAARPRKRVANG